MRYALSSKFVLIENTEPSGHLYEIPHVAKAAECVTVVLQESGEGRHVLTPHKKETTMTNTATTPAFAPLIQESIEC